MRFMCALVLACSIAACASGGSEAAERRADTTARRDSIAAVAASTMNENAVVGLLALTHASDSAVGALGATTGASTEVKEFGRMILREHHALRKDVLDVGAQLGLTPENPRVPPDTASAQSRESMDNASAGPAWDRAYMDYAIAEHQAALENTARALAATQRPEIKLFISKSVPILQKHIDKARSLRKALPKPSPTPGR